VNQPLAYALGLQAFLLIRIPDETTRMERHEVGLVQTGRWCPEGNRS
jgi:hypothetical protein